MKIVLYQPQIPQNTGNIARTCVAASAGLVLVHPLGFSTQNRHLKRAGLDYWKDVNVEAIDDLSAYLENQPFFFFSSKADKPYTDARFPSDSVLIFGSETTGLPEIFWEKWPDRFFTIPMAPNARCLNLACSAAIVLYEALRQNHFLNKEKNNDKITLNNKEVVSGT